MLAIRNPEAIDAIGDPHIRELVELRFAMLGAYGCYHPDTHGWFVVLASDDDPASGLSVGCPDLLLDDDGVAYGKPDFLGYEWIGDHGDCFELVRVVNGVSIAIFIPKPVQHPDLHRLCTDLSERVL